MTILESARVLSRLIGNGSLKRPQRTLRFIWGPEVEGTMAYLSRHPDIRASMRADIHMDMVGGDLFKNKSVLHVTQTPWSLPTFVTDIGAALAETIRDAATVYAEDGSHEDAAVLEDRDGASGTRNAFFVDETPYAEGSDHDDYDSSTIAVPSLYLRDWPDIYIHTDHDTLLQIDPTKLRRVALLGAASGYSFATMDAASAALVLPFLSARAQQRLAQGFNRALLLTQQPELSPPRSAVRGPQSSDCNCFIANRPACSPSLPTRAAVHRGSRYSSSAQKPSGGIEWLADPSGRNARSARCKLGAGLACDARKRRGCRIASASSGR